MLLQSFPASQAKTRWLIAGKLVVANNPLSRFARRSHQDAEQVGVGSRDVGVEVLRREFWRLEIVAFSSTAWHAAKANAERRREIEANLRALGTDIGYGDRYISPAFAGAV